ncbi:MAG: Smr/MutS family protein [Bdellovibrionales bacterium]|nr:Smr/MutS family protein [Bdellovibrionales bacterium]
MRKNEKLPTLDLHGYTTDQVQDAVELFLNRENGRKSSRVRIMPGKGEGKVKKEVLHYLKLAHYPWQYEVQPNGLKNEGVLIVFLD